MASYMNSRYTDGGDLAPYGIEMYTVDTSTSMKYKFVYIDYYGSSRNAVKENYGETVDIKGQAVYETSNDADSMGKDYEDTTCRLVLAY